jgi:hypothetical protein
MVHRPRASTHQASPCVGDQRGIGKQVLRKGLSPLATTITEAGALVIAGMRLRAGKSNSRKGAGRMVAQAIATARAAGITGQILVRGDSAFGTRAVVAACRRAGAQFSLVLTKNTAVQKAIDAIPEDGWTRCATPARSKIPTLGCGSLMPRSPKSPTPPSPPPKTPSLHG